MSSNPPIVSLASPSLVDTTMHSAPRPSNQRSAPYPTSAPSCSTRLGFSSITRANEAADDYSAYASVAGESTLPPRSYRSEWTSNEIPDSYGGRDHPFPASELRPSSDINYLLIHGDESRDLVEVMSTEIAELKRHNANLSNRLASAIQRKDIFKCSADRMHADNDAIRKRHMKEVAELTAIIASLQEQRSQLDSPLPNSNHTAEKMSTQETNFNFDRDTGGKDTDRDDSFWWQTDQVLLQRSAVGAALEVLASK